MVQPDKRVLWHPRHKNKFIVGGNSQITLYEWAPDHPEIRHVTSQHDLQLMKCFAWSPDPLLDDLVAVGLGTGKVDLLRIEAGKQSYRRNVLSSGPTTSLPVKNTRPCNALAFCSSDPSYLAVGLDKVRGDSSLVIWDLSSSMPALSIPLVGRHDSQYIDNTGHKPRSSTYIPRMDGQQQRLDQRIVQQHAQTEVVSALTFLPSTTHLLLASISHRWLRLFDLRVPTANLSTPGNNAAIRVQGIATDPFDPHRVACHGDSLVSLWDSRKINQPIISFSERDALADGARTRPGSVYTGIEFSSTRRGCLASLEKDSSYVRFWDISEAKASSLDGSFAARDNSSDGETNRSSRESSRAARRSWANLAWPSGGEKQHLPQQREREQSVDFLAGQPSFVLSDTRRTKFFSRPLASFALVPNVMTNGQHPLTSNAIVVNKDGDLELYAIHDTPKQLAWSAKGDLAIGAGIGMKVIQGEREEGSDLGVGGPSALSDYHNVAGDERDMTDGTRTSRSRSDPSRSVSDPRTRGRQPLDANAAHLIPPLPVIPSTPVSPPALFGRGDEDGFPALATPTPTSAILGEATPTAISTHSRTVPLEDRTYSPARVMKYGAGKGAERGPSGLSRRRSPSRTDTIPADDYEPEQYARNGRWSQLGSDPTSARAKSRSRDPASRARQSSRKSGPPTVVEEDVSMLMKSRVKAGYGLTQLQQNVAITRNDGYRSDDVTDVLSGLWAWLYHSHEVLCIPTPRLHGYDFSFQGLLGIWEGLAPIAPQAGPQSHLGDATPIAMQRSLLDTPSFGQQLHPSHAHMSSTSAVFSGISAGAANHRKQRSSSPADDLHGNWAAALTILAARRGADRSSWRPTVPTTKLIQRKIALQVVGWSLRDDELAAAINRWEKEGQSARAACWLVFTKQYGKAVELLMRSEDETHQMMSGTVAALAPLMSSSGSAKGLELRELYGRLIIRLNDPYFRMLLTHLSTNEWPEVLDEELIPFRERLAIAFQFLDDKALTSYLRRATEQAIEHGSIDGLIVTGLTRRGMRIIQSYVDHTSDVQSAAILSSYVCPRRFKDNRAERWLETYRDLLDGFKLHHLRVGFDIERGQMLHEAMQNGDLVGVEDWAPRQIFIRCYYCNKPVHSPAPGSFMSNAQPPKTKPTQCGNCARELPRCSVCLMTLSIVNDATREAELNYAPNKDTFDDAIVICQTCRHGGHAAHILEWFLGEGGRRTHQLCPVADCNCRCAEEL